MPTRWSGEMSSQPSLIAYYTGVRPRWDIVPAGRWRDWMHATDARFANRCLPLLMANESGWWLLNSHGFTATWDGSKSPAGLEVRYDEEISAQRAPAESNFGYGIVTWRVPYLFRTDPGWNLLARGPANLPKHGASALEGLIETDWSVATFTMNWKLTEPGTAVRFDAGEPICQIAPSAASSSRASRRERPRSPRTPSWKRPSGHGTPAASG
jgi:hypothetical protein